jgi:hypothetical protein
VIGLLAPTDRFNTDPFTRVMAQTTAELDHALTQQL